MLGLLDEAAAVSGGSIIWDPKAFMSGTGKVIYGTYIGARIRACR